MKDKLSKHKWEAVSRPARPVVPQGPAVGPFLAQPMKGQGATVRVAPGQCSLREGRVAHARMPVDSETEKSSACAHRGIGPSPHPRVSQQRCLGDSARTVRPWWPWPASCSPRSLSVPLGPIVSFARSPETPEVPANEAHHLGQQSAGLLSCPVGLAKRGPGRCMDESPWKTGLNRTPHLG